MNVNKKVLAVVLSIASLVAVPVYYHWNGLFEEEPQNTIKLYGNVDIRQVEIAFYATGRVKRLLVEEGERVEKGALLGEMDPTRYEAALNQAEANLSAMEEELAIRKIGARPQNVKRARARVTTAQARLDEAEASYWRYRALWQSGSIPKEHFDNAQMAYRTARAGLKEAREALSLAKEGFRRQEISAAEAQVKAAQAAVALASNELADTRMFAPAEGVIQKRILECGDMAFPETPVYTLALTEPIWVRAYLPESYLGKIKPGYEANITTDSYPKKVYSAWVGYISPTAEFTPKHVQTEELRTKLVYEVRIHAYNPHGELRLGMPVTVSISLDQPDPQGRGLAPCDQKGSSADDQGE
jgi:HlyD family secretion protein